jgi:hypothetical protein
MSATPTSRKRWLTCGVAVLVIALSVCTGIALFMRSLNRAHAEARMSGARFAAEAVAAHLQEEYIEPGVPLPESLAESRGQLDGSIPRGVRYSRSPDGEGYRLWVEDDLLDHICVYRPADGGWEAVQKD